MTEIEWRPVAGYEGRYEVSNTGLVRGLDRLVVRPQPQGDYWIDGQMMTVAPDPHGVWRVRLRRGGKSSKSHDVAHLVLEAFVGARPPGLVCCHWDDDKANNHVANLRWDTQSANRFDAVRNGIDPFASRTACVNGHEFNEENSYFNGRYRVCRPCRRRIKRQYRARVRGAAA